MIASQRYYYDDFSISLREILHSYNSSCPSMCKYDKYSVFPYMLTSTMLTEILLKKIIFKVKGRYIGVHQNIRLVHSINSSGISLRDFTKDEIKFLELDHSIIRYDFIAFKGSSADEDVVDSLFEYFLDLAISLGVE